MSDTIQKWLRETSGLGISHPHLSGYTSRHCEAADEIDRLRAELAEKDKRIEKLVSKRDSLVRFDAMKETLLRQANARIAELEAELAAKNAIVADLGRYTGVWNDAMACEPPSDPRILGGSDE